MSTLGIYLAILLSLVGSGLSTWGQSLQDESIAESHVQANVPDQKNFDRFLKRDLEQYFRDTKKKIVTVEYELLRKGPIQSGIAYPKFYAWATIHYQGTVDDEGAVRLAAVEKKRFDVTHFVTKADIERSPMTLDRIFP